MSSGVVPAFVRGFVGGHQLQMFVGHPLVQLVTPLVNNGASLSAAKKTNLENNKRKHIWSQISYVLACGQRNLLCLI